VKQTYSTPQQKLQKNTDYDRRKVIVPCRKIRIWKYVCDPDNAPEWYTRIESVEWKTPKPVQDGIQGAFFG
jgi:hypothetical protein